MTTLITRKGALTPSTLDPEARTVEAVASTGADRLQYDAHGPFRELLEISESAIDLASLRGLPVLDSHQRDSIDRILGRITAARIENRQLIVTLELLPGRAFEMVRSGMLKGLSIGYSVEQWRSEGNGPRRTKTATRFTIREISLVAVPADAGAVIRSGGAMEDQDPPIGGTDVIDRTAIDADIRRICDAAQIERSVADRLIAIGADVAAARRLALEAIRTQPLRVTVTRSSDDPAERIEAMADGLYARINPAHTPGERGRQYAHLRLLDHAEQAVRAAGLSTTGLNQYELVQRAMSTSDLPAVFAAVLNKGLRAAYEAARRPIMDLSRERQANDFRPLQDIKFDGKITPLPVTENGEYQHGAFVDAKESYASKRFGRLAGISPEMVVNDDTGALSRIPDEFGRAWAGFEADQLLALVVSNSGAGPVLSDGSPVFHAIHGNLAASGAPIDVDELSAAVLAMRKQRGLAGEIINVVPSVILVSPDQEVPALATVAQINPATADAVNPWTGKFKVAVEPGLSGDAWYLVASNIGGLEHAYVAGWKGPKVSTETDFNTSGLKMKMEGTFGCGFVDHRGWYRNAGA